MKEPAPLCKCGKPLPPRPSRVGYRPRCDSCERQVAILRDRNYRRRKGLKGLQDKSKVTSRVQRP